MGSVKTLRQRHLAMSIGLAIAVLAGPAAGTKAGATGDPLAPRAEVSLSGSWQYQSAKELATLPSSDSWQPCQVPGYLQGYDYRRAWLRRSFQVPAAMRGKRIKIHFEGVKYNSRVLVNGDPVGGCFGGYRPFDVDVTDAVRFDGPNELLVGCHDWTGLFTPGAVDFSRTRGSWDSIRGRTRSTGFEPVTWYVVPLE